MAKPRESRPETTRLPPIGDFDPVADAYRRWGYLQADLDGLGRLERLVHPDIADTTPAAPAETVDRLRRAYCGPIGAEFMHMMDRERVRWVAERMESDVTGFQPGVIFSQLAGAEVLERFLHARYVGTKRYSLEGVAGIMPLIEAILDGFAGRGGELALIAMSHRGRMNVMANVVGVPESDLFAGIEDVGPRSVLGSGDVKYHLGATGVHRTVSGGTLTIHLVSNPSHLEAVDPVIMGRVRAKQDRAGEKGVERVLSLTLHGDAAFAGQGIASETINLGSLPGYTVGGSIHVIVNNLIGFTAEYPLLHSSRFSSDLAKRLSIPILHVNGEDPEAVVRAGKIAADYRSTFFDDVIVDLIGYRRYGHSEVEDPSTTQPLLYAKIEKRPTLYEMYASRIGMTPEEVEEKRGTIWARLAEEQEAGRKRSERPSMRTMPPYWDAYSGGPYNADDRVETAVPIERLREIAERITTLPAGFKPHPKIQRVLEQRRMMARGEFPIDWGTAETLAYASLLWEGSPVRLSGQDSRRGTFNQRHAVLVDVESGKEYTPLANLRPGQGRFTAVDSPLSELAALGYEYGYSRDYPDALVLWEAQFGDFANGAQIIIDQFVTAAEDKWRLLSGLVMLLPHGYEGQGPEHSSARVERFLQLAAEDNIQVCQPATSCEYFHLLRRQALQRWRKPLVLFTPKSLLRAKVAGCRIDAFSAPGGPSLVRSDGRVSNAERLLICSGKISHELRAERDRRQDGKTAILTITQLYPFPRREFEDAIAKHPGARKVVWVQEEPGNMGPLVYIRPILQRFLGDRHVTSIKRSESASPATGSAKAHALEQAALIKLAFA